jgi:hypothetical protein
MPKPGNHLYLSLVMFDSGTPKYPLAHVRDAAGIPIAGSPVALTDLGTGLYTDNGTLVMPDTPGISVQTIVYTDAGHTTLDSLEGNALDLFTWDDDGPMLAEGDLVAFSSQTVDGDTAAYARVSFSDGADQILGTANLVHVANGLYRYAGALTMPDTPVLRAHVQYFSDAGYSVASDSHADDLIVFYLAPVPPDTQSILNLAIPSLKARIRHQRELIGRIENELELQGRMPSAHELRNRFPRKPELVGDVIEDLI